VQARFKTWCANTGEPNLADLSKTGLEALKKGIKMNQQEFEQLMQKEGFETVVVERPANGSLDLHTHPFAARALILDGEITIVAEGRTQHCRTGDTFALDANIPHTEVYGPTGVRYVAGRKHTA
jgi:quercetin dioxygenase-like cupin family protein